MGDEHASSGVYRPRSYELTFRGDDVAQHHMLHLHEIHHKALNDDTAWGSFIHFVARHPGWDDELLDRIVRSCRLVHEAFASFMAVSLTGHRHQDIDRVLDAYPVYLPLVRRMERLLRPVPAGHRQELAATAVARFCMGPPIFDLLKSCYPNMVTLSEIPSSWLPDQRFSVFGGIGAAVVGAAVIAADVGFARAYGRPFETLVLDETDERLDSAWSTWEADFIASLVDSEPRLRGLASISANAHLPLVAELVETARARGVLIQLPHQLDELNMSDVESVQRIFTATELRLRPTPWPSALAEVGIEVAASDVLSLASGGTRPALIIHGRTPAHVRIGFAFPQIDATELEARGEPIFAVRLLVDDDGRDLILNVTIPTPEAYNDLVEAWPTGHLIANCITTSCYTSTNWQSSWLPALNAKPTVLLVDMGLIGMVGEGRLLGNTEPVYGSYIGLDATSFTALVWHVEGHPHVMVAIADDLTIQLFAGQLQDLLGDRLSMHDADWSEWVAVLSAVCASVLGTEGSLRFDGMGRT